MGARERVDEVLRVNSDVAELYPDAKLSARAASVTEGIIGMRAKTHAGHIGF